MIETRHRWSLLGDASEHAITITDLGTYILRFRDAPYSGSVLGLQLESASDDKLGLVLESDAPSPDAEEVSLHGGEGAGGAAPNKHNKTSVFSRVTEAITELEDGHVALNTPDKMVVGKTETIQIALGVNASVADLQSEITAKGKQETADLKVGARMTATLVGGGAFDISPSGPQQQFVTGRALHLGASK